MSKLINLPIVVSLATLVAACDMSGEEKKVSQRDVYASLEDCVADWGDTELCEREIKEAREHAEKMAAANSKNGANIIPIIMGPPYFDGYRSISHNGREFTPKSTTSTRTANFTQTPSGRVISYTPPNTSATQATQAAKAAGTPRSAFVSRGGIGATGSSSAS